MMDLALLKCSVCPKQPSFSDTSHLLTHVGSKGHLSALHKLQIRSHQEMGANLELATYNQWYQHHSLGQLLSERLLLKEKKQARKRGNPTRRAAADAYTIPIDNTMISPRMPAKRPAPPRQKHGPRTRRSRRAGNDSDSDFSPARRPKRRTRAPTVSPVKLQQSIADNLCFEEDCPAEDEPVTAATPEHAKLKGTVWPGMALFDAATPEMKRKRNQKKDGSVLRRMERLAAQVEPTEVVYSPGGQIMKARHIDDLEDASSLIDGESPLPKLKPVRSRKRQPLADKDPNAPRLAKRKTKNTAPKGEVDLPMGHGVPPLPYLRSSSTGDLHTLGLRYPPTEDEGDDFKFAVNAFAPRKKPPPFNIYTNGSPGYRNNGAINEGRNPLHLGPAGYGSNQFPQLPKISTPWLQPQYQSTLQFTNLYTSYRPLSQEIQGFYEMDDEGKENMPQLPDAETIYRGPSTNPLTWKSPVRPATDSGSPSDSPFGGLFGMFTGTSPPEDPFVTAKNPLANPAEIQKMERAPFELNDLTKYDTASEDIKD